MLLLKCLLTQLLCFCILRCIKNILLKCELMVFETYINFSVILFVFVLCGQV